MEPLRITIPTDPGDASVNRAYKPALRRRGKGRSQYATMVKTDRGKAFEEISVLMCRSARSSQLEVAMDITLSATVRVVIRSYWSRQRRLEGAGDLALGDVDAPIKACLDALEKAQVIDDDVRVATIEVSKHVDKARPRIEMEVYPCTTQ